MHEPLFTGPTPSAPFPEIDENGWYVDKPRAQADFPNVCIAYPLIYRELRQPILCQVSFWHKREWQEAEKTSKLSTVPGEERGKRGPTRMAEGENVTLRFITDTDGTPVDGQRAQMIRRRFREFCVYLYNKKMAPATWQHGIDKEIVVAYHHWMRTQCYELQLCEDNWKADKVAVISNYTQWKKKHEEQVARDTAKTRNALKKPKKTKQRHVGDTPNLPCNRDGYGREPS
ncbi:hypothetical protein BN946_scf184983.g28 [Trametes cinnabarina]|uniref:Uncharacterized protein n=1 Tax=Pycnoporus cinnabarinus TaxID=5643 RepID=A0A060SDU4_PYCCI|nr:hypothetical protein BN946_scf184983.g28 [Trametes cinnabarina]